MDAYKVVDDKIILKGNAPSEMVKYLLDVKKLSAEFVADRLSADSGRTIEPRQVIQIILAHYSVKKWLFQPLLKLALEHGWLPNSMYEFEIVHVKLLGFRVPMHQMDTANLFEAMNNLVPVNEQLLAERFAKCAAQWRELKGLD